MLLSGLNPLLLTSKEIRDLEGEPVWKLEKIKQQAFAHGKRLSK